MQVDVQGWSGDFDQLAEQMRAMLEEMHGRNYFQSHASRSWRPSLNLYETAKNFIVCVDLAGMPREGIEIRADRGVLHIQGNRGRPRIPERARPCQRRHGCGPASEEVSVHLMEIDSGRFHRRVPIEPDVIVDEISAIYQHGYLWVIMPRAASSSETNGP